MDDCLNLLGEYAAPGQEEFLRSPLNQDAIIRRMEILSDAASHLSLELQERHGDVPWRAIAGFRNVVAHGYMGVAMARVWEYLMADVPALRAVVSAELDK